MAKVHPNVTQFVQQYYPMAEAWARELNVPVSAILGQIGIESAWGKKILPGSNNLTNIKEFGKGPSVRAIDNGYASNFKKYGSTDDWWQDFSGISRRLYPGVVGAKTAQAYAEALMNGKGGRKYAENPNYVRDIATGAQMVQNSMGALGIKYDPTAATYKASAGQQAVQDPNQMQYFTPEAQQGQQAKGGFMDNLQGKSGPAAGDISPLPTMQGGIAVNNYNQALDLNALGGNIGELSRNRIRQLRGL